MKKIVIDAGHGGDDPGASKNGIIEKNLTLDISKYMYDKLKSLNIPVTLIRNKDETIDPDERVKRILNAYGDSNDVIVISNHINAGGGDGAEVIYALRNTDKLSNLILENLESAGQNIRKAYQKRLPSDTSKDYYFIHRNTKSTEPVIIEYGFLDSTLDDVTQLKNDYKLFADKVVDAIVEYINNESYYTVSKGDTLYSIAKKFNTTVDNIKLLNNLTSNSLAINQKLIVPNNKANTYTVSKGDNLYSLAKKFNTTQSELMKINNLKSNLLSIGQVLIIPSNTVNAYTVSKGDSLWSIAKKFNTTVEDIKRKNSLNSNLLSIGQILKI